MLGKLLVVEVSTKLIQTKKAYSTNYEETAMPFGLFDGGEDGEHGNFVLGRYLTYFVGMVLFHHLQ